MKISIRTLPEEVANRIRDMIRMGELQKGDRIVEATLCERLGISRTPLREALRILSSEGLVDVIPHRGAHVAEPSMRDIREMFQVMSLLEGECARVVAGKMTDDMFEKVATLHEKLERHFDAKDHEAYLRVNQEYHLLIQEMTDNRVLNEVVNGLRQKILLHRYRQLYQPDRFNASIQEHRDLLEAFRQRDSDAAEGVMKRHLMNQCESLTSLYDDGGSGVEKNRGDDPTA